MKLIQRLKFYGVGLGVGLVFLLVFTNQKSCSSWFPNQRVLTAINSSIIYISERNECILDCNQLSKQDVFSVLTQGDVDFSSSDVENLEKRYRIENENLSLDILLNYSDSTVKLLSIIDAENCESCKDKSEHFNIIFNVSEQMILSEMELKPVYLNEQSNCEIKCLEMTKDDFLTKLKKAKADFQKSKITAKPYPIYHFDLDSTSIQLEVGQEQIRVIDVRSRKENCNCK